MPGRLEYSQKDDKFRLITLGGRRHVIRLQSLLFCELDEPFRPESYREASRQAVLDLEITNERKALERMMLHFSHLRKETERKGENLYRMRLWYQPEDETELVILVLSFGPMVRVIAPEDVRRQVVQRLTKQMALF